MHGRSGAAYHAISGTMRFQRKDFLAVPAAMPELHRDPHPAWDELEEIGGPSVIARVRRRELDQQHGALITQLVPAHRDARQQRLRRV
jgi:hypothetical protein